jgi:hypothetical protein
MSRILAREEDRGAAAAGAATAAPDARAFDRRLLALGLLLGLAALTRSEAIYLGFAWAAAAWFWTPGSRRRRAAMIAVPAAVAVAVLAPWAVRDWSAFGTPLPGQTIANALYLHPTDIFAYRDLPTLARYLGAGPAQLAVDHLAGIAHNLFNVLLIPAFPVGLVGLLVLPWVGSRKALRPLTLTAVFTFLVASLVFPVATQSGTFLHAAGSILVLLAVSCVVALDGFIVRIGRIRHWTNPVAWLGPAFAIAALVPLCAVSIGGIARAGDEVRTRYEALPAAMARAGVPLDDAHPVITDNPIWLAEATHVRALALPEESPEAVLDLAHRFGVQILIVRSGTGRDWPDVLNRGGAAAACFQEVPLGDMYANDLSKPSDPTRIHVFRIICP